MHTHTAPLRSPFNQSSPQCVFLLLFPNLSSDVFIFPFIIIIISSCLCANEWNRRRRLFLQLGRSHGGGGETLVGAEAGLEAGAAIKSVAKQIK